MIEIVTGVVGGGKTILAVRRCVERLAAGGRIYTNIDMQPRAVGSYLRRTHGVFLRAGQMNFLSEKEGVKDWWDEVGWGTLDCPTLCVIDEAQLFWNAKDYQKTGKEERDMLSFLTQSRKAGVDVTFITQDEKTIESNFRRQAQTIILAQNMAHRKIPGLGISLRGLINYSYYDTKAGHRYKMEWWRIRKEFFKLYKTEAFLDSLMSEMAATRERLGRFALVRVPWVIRLFEYLKAGDFVERWAARNWKWFRGIVAAELIKARRQRDESNTIDSIRRGGGGLRGVSPEEIDLSEGGNDESGDGSSRAA